MEPHGKKVILTPLRHYLRVMPSITKHHLTIRDAQYYETPFDDPMIGIDVIYKYWKDNAELGQKDVSFSYNVLAVDRNVGLAHWRANFKRLPSGNMVKLDGIFKVEFSDDGKCEVFREWWHRIEEPAFD